MSGDSLERTMRMLTHNEVYFARPSDFGDPFECRPNISFEASFEEKVVMHARLLRPSLSESEATRRASEIVGGPDFSELESEGQANLQALMESTGIFCMSEICDDILMWSQYADGHKGICVEFHATKIEHASFFLPYKVEYQENLPVVNVYRNDYKKKVKKCVRTKASHWEYEKEWRIVDMEHGPGVQKFPHDLISGVIMGCRISDWHRWLVGKLAADHDPPIAVYKAHVTPGQFALEIAPAVR